MSVQHVDVIVEEPSAEAALQLLLPKMLRHVSFSVYTHQCKAELLLRLSQRLKAYAARRRSNPWFRNHCRIIVLVNRDQEDCQDLKHHIETAFARSKAHHSFTGAGRLLDRQ